MKFTHLHVHTEYSLLDGSNKIKEYVARVKELGMDSAAITDHGVMYGVIDFYRAAKAAAVRCMWHLILVLTEKLVRMRIGITIWCCWRRTIRATVTS